MHFLKLGLATSYRHEVHPDDTFFEDVKVFKDAIIKMHLRHIPEERIIVLGQDPNIDRLEWQKQCFKVKPSKKKDQESDKEESDKKKDEEAGKEQGKEKFDDPSVKEKSTPKDIAPPRPKDPEVDKEIAPRFDLKPTSNPGSRSQDPKDFQTLKAHELELPPKSRGDS